MSIRYHNNHKHQPSFYEAVIAVLVASASACHTYSQTATALTAAGLGTPTGQAWTDNHVKQTLKSLRNSAAYPSRLHTALMTFVFAGAFTAEQALSILEYKRTQ